MQLLQIGDNIRIFTTELRIYRSHTPLLNAMYKKNSNRDTKKALLKFEQFPVLVMFRGATLQRDTIRNKAENLKFLEERLSPVE